MAAHGTTEDRHERIHLLWDRLADFDASQSDAALMYLLGSLCDIVDAQDAYWLGGVRMSASAPDDPVLGWRPRAVRYLHSTAANETTYKTASRQLERGVIDPCIVAQVRRAGRFRAHLLRDLVAPDYFATPFYRDLYSTRQIVDTAFVVFPLNADAECYFAFHRKAGYPPFDRGDCDALAYGVRGIKWFHRQVMLNHGLLVAHAPLTPAERKVLQLLLTGASEKKVAADLGNTYTTAHRYVTEIFRKFGVRSRAELTALWLGRTPNATQSSNNDDTS